MPEHARSPGHPMERWTPHGTMDTSWNPGYLMDGDPMQPWRPHGTPRKTGGGVRWRAPPAELFAEYVDTQEKLQQEAKQ
jgi:hypothetical protein